MGFLKERKRAKELETSYNEIVAFRKKVEGFSEEKLKADCQSIYDECVIIMKKLESAKVIVLEDLQKSSELLSNCWFASRDALAYEHNIHQKRFDYLKNEEAFLTAFKEKMLDSIVKSKNEASNVKEQEPGE